MIFRPGAVLAELVVQEALEADHVEHEQVALHRFGEVPAGEDLGAADGRVRTSPGFGACLVSIAGKYFLAENDGPWYG